MMMFNSMLEIASTFLDNDSPKNTSFLAICIILYLIILWGAALFNIFMFSLFVATGFWFFTSLSSLFRFKNSNDTSKRTEYNQNTFDLFNDVIITTYKKTCLVFLIGFIIVSSISLFELDKNFILNSGSGNLKKQFFNPYIPSSFEIFLIISILIFSFMLPYFFSKWVIPKFFIDSQTTEIAPYETFTLRKILSIGFIIVILFSIFEVSNILFIDAHVNSSALVGIEFIIPYVTFLLVIQVIFLISSIIVMWNFAAGQEKVRKSKNFVSYE